MISHLPDLSGSNTENQLSPSTQGCEVKMFSASTWLCRKMKREGHSSNPTQNGCSSLFDCLAHNVADIIITQELNWLV
jgi:hypothetical protein